MIRIISFLVFSIFLIFVAACGELGEALSLITVFPAPYSVSPGISKQFTAYGFSAKGKSIAITPSWSVTNGIGTISNDGVFTAGQIEASGYIVASDANISGQALVTVTTFSAVSGTVRYSDLSRASGVRVFLSSNNSKYSISASDGTYTISNIPSGRSILETGEGARYISTTAEVTVATAETRTANISLLPRFSLVNEVITTVGSVYVTGSIRNNGSTTAEGVTVTYAFTDSIGDLVGAYVASAGNISPGQSGAFSVSTNLLTTDYSTITRNYSATSY